jgi:hypothetical protein
VRYALECKFMVLGTDNQLVGVDFTLGFAVSVWCAM